MVSWSLLMALVNAMVASAAPERTHRIHLKSGVLELDAARWGLCARYAKHRGEAVPELCPVQAAGQATQPDRDAAAGQSWRAAAGACYTDILLQHMPAGSELCAGV